MPLMTPSFIGVEMARRYWMIVVAMIVLPGNIGCKNSTIVYICASTNARHYHLRENCPGLRNCTYQIVSTTEIEAGKSGKTLCAWEKDK